jgi:hypothetical protein
LDQRSVACGDLRLDLCRRRITEDDLEVIDFVGDCVVEIVAAYRSSVSPGVDSDLALHPARLWPALVADLAEDDVAGGRVLVRVIGGELLAKVPRLPAIFTVRR